jgi:hypothetical protein
MSNQEPKTGDDVISVGVVYPKSVDASVIPGRRTLGAAALTIAWLSIGATILAVSLLVGGSVPEARQILTTVVRVYGNTTPLIVMLRALIAQKHIAISILSGTLMFVFCLWLSHLWR